MHRWGAHAKFRNAAGSESTALLGRTGPLELPARHRRLAAVRQSLAGQRKWYLHLPRPQNEMRLYSPLDLLPHGHDRQIKGAAHAPDRQPGHRRHSAASRRASRSAVRHGPLRSTISSPPSAPGCPTRRHRRRNSRQPSSASRTPGTFTAERSTESKISGTRR